MELVTLAGYSARSHNAIVYDKGEDVVVYPVGKTLVVRQGLDESSSQVLLKGHTDDVTCISLSRCGRYLISGQTGIDSDVCLWDMKELRLLFRWSEHDFGVNVVGFSADSLFAFTIGCPNDGQLIIWEVSSGKIVSRTQLPLVAKNNTPGSTSTVTYNITYGVMGGRIRTSKGVRLAEYPLALCSTEGALLWIYFPNDGRIEPYGDTKSGLLPSSLSKREVNAACFTPGFAQSVVEVSYNKKDKIGTQIPDQSPSFLVCGTSAGELLIYDIRGLGKVEYKGGPISSGVCGMPSSSVTLRGVFAISRYSIESMCEYEFANRNNIQRYNSNETNIGAQYNTGLQFGSEPRRRVYRTLEGLNGISQQEYIENPSLLLTTRDGCLILITPALLIGATNISEVTKSVGPGATEPGDGAELLYQTSNGKMINAIACSPRLKNSTIGDNFNVVSSVIIGFTDGEIGELDILKSNELKNKNIKTTYSVLHTGPGLPIECIQPLSQITVDTIPKEPDDTEGIFVCSEGEYMRIFDAFNDLESIGITWIARGYVGHKVHCICCVNTGADGDNPEDSTPIFLAGSLDGYLVNVEMVDEEKDPDNDESLLTDVSELNVLWEIPDGDRRGVSTVLYQNNATMIQRPRGLVTSGQISSRLPGNLCKYNSSGPTMVIGGTTGDIRIWDIRTRKLIVTVKEHKKNIISIIKISLLDISDYLLLVASGDDVITLFRVIGGDKVVRISDIFSKSTLRGLSGVVFENSSQDFYAISVSTDARVHAYRIGRVGQPLLEEIQTVQVDASGNPIGSATLPGIPTTLFSDGGSKLLCPSIDYSISLIEVMGMVPVPGGEALGVKIVGTHTAHSAPVISGAIHGHYAATCDADGMLALWRVE